MGMIADDIKATLLQEQQPAAGHAEDMGRFFKAYPGGYGEGDQFLGITVPVIRRVAKTHRQMSLTEIQQLLDSPWHEVRLVAVIIMAEQFKRADEPHRKILFDLYLQRTDAVNNWDLVDLSCRDIVGWYILLHPEKAQVLTRLAASSNIWERRIAMVSTWQLIRVGQLDQTFAIATLLLSDKHDLIHKAVGWMLREAGKKDEARLKEYLTEHIAELPRTSLRYAIERFDAPTRVHYMKLK
jgi:3-methyladenine DNA glycosylase AlkD